MGLIGLLPYLIAAGVLLGALGGAYYKGREAGKEVVREELVPKLTACEGREKGLQGQIEVQNRAVASLKAEGDARIAKAASGLRAAQEAARTGTQEAARLRSLAGTMAKPGACPAGEAVKTVREGLK